MQPVTALSLRLKNELPEVKRATDALRESWVQHALPEDMEVGVTMCLEEIVSNVIRHGSLPRENCEIRVECRIIPGAPGGIEIEVFDNAAAFDPLTLPPPDLTAPLGQRKAGGLGVFLVRQMMDEVRYERRDGRNHLVFRKNWQPPGLAIVY